MKRIFSYLLLITSLNKACYFPVPEAPKFRNVEFVHKEQQYCLKIPLNPNETPALYRVHGSNEILIESGIQKGTDALVLHLNTTAAPTIKYQKSSPHHIWWNGSLITRSRL